MSEQVKVYDFKKPQRFSTDNLRFVSVISEEYCKGLTTYMAYEMKKPKMYCRLDKVEQTNYDEFIGIVNEDAVIIEFDMKPLVKNMIYQIDRPIALTLIDLISGGDGKLRNYEREITDIDKELLAYTSNQFLANLHVIEGCEKNEIAEVNKNIASSRKYPVSESVILAHMTIMNDDDEEMGKTCFCLPYTCMEPVLTHMETKKLFRDKDIEYDSEFSNAIYKSVCGTDSEISVSLGQTLINVRDLLNLKVDDIITLDTGIADDIEVFVESAKSFMAKPGLIKDKRAVIITDVVGKER
ncbi:MAG: FliM/FliN family flagellar motor switch protein [Peptostreptococcaceae bacterium]